MKVIPEVTFLSKSEHFLLCSSIFLYYWKPTSLLRRESGLTKHIQAILNDKVCLTHILLRTGTALLRINHSYNKRRCPKPLTCSQEL